MNELQNISENQITHVFMCVLRIFVHQARASLLEELRGKNSMNYFTSSDPHHDISIICLDAIVRSMLP